jgi:hypothetical protein
MIKVFWKAPLAGVDEARLIFSKPNEHPVPLPKRKTGAKGLTGVIFKGLPVASSHGNE